MVDTLKPLYICVTKAKNMTTVTTSQVFIVRYGNSITDVSATENINDCSAACINYIQKHNYGASQWRGGAIKNRDGKKIGRVSYNGRIWDNKNNPLS